jgi:hypothetical protein
MILISGQGSSMFHILPSGVAERLGEGGSVPEG